MDYIPATEKDIREMLKLVGVGSINELVKEFSPAFTDKLNLPQPKSELQLIPQ